MIMKHLGILNEISNTQWAMNPEAFTGMLSIINGDDAERSVFHSVDEASRIEAFTGNLGEPVEETQLTRINGNVGFLDIDGPIVHRASGVSKVSGLTSIQGLTREFQGLAENEDINEIVLLLDTPGGVVKGTSEFADMIAKCDKRVTAYVWGTAASAGYWIASAADQVFSSNTGIVGSIGVVLTYDLNKATGIGKVISSQSPNKQLEPNTPKGRKEAQKLVDNLANVFIGAVASGRSVTVEKVKKDFGQGNVFIASEAKERGMIDDVKTLSELVIELKNKDDDYSYTVSEGIDDFKIHLDPVYVDADTSNTHEINIEDKQAGAPIRVKAKNGGKPMTLKELMAEHPEIKTEIEAIKQESFEAGAGSVQARIDQVVPYFEKKEYPKQLAELGIKVLKGEHNVDALIGAVTVFDAQAEHDKLRGAQQDSQDIKPTPAQQEPDMSKDGVVRNAADEEAMLARLTEGHMN